MKKNAIFLSLVILVLLTGCKTADQVTLEDQITELQKDKSKLSAELEQVTEENVKLKEQLKVLSGVSPEAKLNNVASLQRISLSRYTGFYDKDKNGTLEKLIVYMMPVDKGGDVVKVPGSVVLELWDLGKESDQALLKKWRIESTELKDLWFDALLTSSYRLTFDVESIIADEKGPFTLKVSFVDYIAGRKFDAQKLIEK